MANEIFIGLGLWLALINLCCDGLSIDPIVSLSSGLLLRGSKLMSTQEQEFLAFRGIPYGQPPVGPLRFQVSQLYITGDVLVVYFTSFNIRYAKALMWYIMPQILCKVLLLSIFIAYIFIRCIIFPTIY